MKPGSGCDLSAIGMEVRTGLNESTWIDLEVTETFEAVEDG